MLVPLDGRGEATPYINSTANETGAVLWPDGAWLAYQSDESGRNEAYVQRFPVPSVDMPAGVRRPFAPLADGSFVFNLASDSTPPQRMRIGLNWAAR